jgi:hypothetical protein
MIDEKLLDALVQARRVQPDMDYDALWNMVHASQNAIPGDLGDEVRKIQAGTGLTFEEAFDIIEAESLPHLRKNETVGMALIRARKAQAAEPLTRDPRISQEMAKITKLGGTNKTATTGDHAEFLAKVRKLMQEQNLSFDQAFDTVIKEKHGIKTTADEPKPLVRVEADAVIPEHPFQAEANRRGLLLIEGGFCNPIC